MMSEVITQPDETPQLVVVRHKPFTGVDDVPSHFYTIAEVLNKIFFFALPSRRTVVTPVIPDFFNPGVVFLKHIDCVL